MAGRSASGASARIIGLSCTRWSWVLSLDAQGRPICCELWPGNTADVTTLIPVVDRLRRRFGIGTVCIVADRGMISRETIEALEAEQRGWRMYILGARMRSQDEVKDEVLSRAGRYRVVYPKRVKRDDPCPLKVKEVWVEDRRYIVCLNEDEARKDAADREAIVAALREQLHVGSGRWSATRATAVTSAGVIIPASRSMRRRSPRMPAMTASGCSAPIPTWTPPRWPSSTASLDGGAVVPVVIEQHRFCKIRLGGRQVTPDSIVTSCGSSPTPR